MLLPQTKKEDGSGDGYGADGSNTDGGVGGGFARQLTPAEVEAIVLQKKLDREEADRKLEEKRRLAQEEEERRAEERGMYAKKQRAEYNDRVVGDDVWVSCQIVGVHLDDGPDKPYYTIKFVRDRGDGSERENMEKQTQPERIRRLVKEEKEGGGKGEEGKGEEKEEEKGEVGMETEVKGKGVVKGEAVEVKASETAPPTPSE